MADIGPIHCGEYGIDIDQYEPVVIAQAHGRVHYLGEHGEPGHGLFLSSAIDRSVRVAVSARKDASLRFYAADFGERKRTTLVNFRYKREDRWANFIKVAIHIFIKLNFVTKGLNFTITGTIPQHIGLASSQAIEIASALALRAFFGVSMSDRELLDRLAAAHEFFFEKSAPIVDYAVTLFAQKDHFLVVDEPTLEIKQVKINLSSYKILIMDARVPRIPIDEELEERQEAIKKGLEVLSHKRTGTTFREYVTVDMLQFTGALSEEIRRRSTHIIQELRRIPEAVQALESADQQALSKIIQHSHESLRDQYEVSCPEIDWLVKRAQEIDGVLGSRMTGHGFGGCTYTIIRENAVSEFKRRLEDYERIFGFHPIIYEVKPGDGARVITEHCVERISN
ncbi:MAG: galactokinase [Spirochaetaceae bacterium]|jgi:galactokinase|nr:galactokinase [Spirochaetaceae bacterium]